MFRRRIVLRCAVNLKAAATSVPTPASGAPASPCATSGSGGGAAVEPYEGLPRYPDSSVLGCLRGVDYLGTASFAISGAMTAIVSGLDFYGVTVVGATCALGGGTFRDILFGRCPCFWLVEAEYLYIAVVFAVGTYLFTYYFGMPGSWLFDQMMFWTDTIGLAGFAVIGTLFGARNAFPWFITLVGTAITCSGGGIVRDLLCRRPVRVMHDHLEAYVETTVAGGAVYLLARSCGVPLHLRVICGAATVFALRLMAIRYDIKGSALVHRLTDAQKRQLAENLRTVNRDV